MNIKIVANFTRRLNGEKEGRFIYLAESLSERGHRVELITTDFYHSTKSVRPQPMVEMYKTKISLCHERGYKKNVSLGRLASHYEWGKNVGKYLSNCKENIDVLYSAVPSLTANKEIVKYCEKHKHTKYIIDIQDVWPDAFTLVMPKVLRWILMPMKWYVDSFYRMADEVVAVSDTYRDRGLRPRSNKQRNGVTVYLGNNGGVFDEGREKYHIEREDDEIWLAYIGTLGYSYDIPCVLEAMSIYKERYPDGKKIRFVVMGSGPFKEQWEADAKKRGLLCDFTGPLHYQEMVGRMCSCDIVVNCLRPGAAQSITNKVGDYALSGLPVINTQSNEEYRKLVDDYQCGINCECGNSDDVAQAINRLSSDEGLRKTMGEGSRRLGVERFDRRTSYIRLIETIESIIKK